jgi:hypothetical protein
MNNLESTQMKNTECTECTGCTDLFPIQYILFPKSAFKYMVFFENVLYKSLNECYLN